MISTFGKCLGREEILALPHIVPQQPHSQITLTLIYLPVWDIPIPGEMIVNGEQNLIYLWFKSERILSLLCFVWEIQHGI